MNNESSCEKEIEYENFKKFLERYFDSTNDINKSNTDENITNFEKFYKFRKEFFLKHPRCDNKLLYDQIFMFIANISIDKADQVLNKAKNAEPSKNTSNPIKVESHQINLNELRINLNNSTLSRDNITRSILQEDKQFEIEDEHFIELPEDEAEKSTKEFLKHFPGFQKSTHFENGNFEEVIHDTNFIYNENNIQSVTLPDTTLNIKSNSKKQKSNSKSSKLQTPKNLRLLEFQQLQGKIAAELETDEVAKSVAGHLCDLFEKIEILHSNLQKNTPSSSENPNENVLSKLVLPNYLKFIQNFKLKEPNIPYNKTNASWKDYWNVKKPNYSEQDVTVFICNYVSVLAVLPRYEDTLSPRIEIRNQSRQRLITELPSTSRDQSIQNVRDESQSSQRNLSSINALVNSSLPIVRSKSIPNVSSLNQSNLATQHYSRENETMMSITPDLTPIYIRQIRESSTPFGHLTSNKSDIPEDIVEVSEILMEDQSLTPTVGDTIPPLINKLQPIVDATDTLTDLNIEMNSDLPMTQLKKPLDKVSTENLKIYQQFPSPAADTHKNIQLNPESIPAENNNLVDLRSSFINTDEYRKNWFEVLRSRNDIEYFNLEVPKKKRKYKPHPKRQKVTRNGILSENEPIAPAINIANQLTTNKPTTIEQPIALHENMIPAAIEEFINQNIEIIEESSSTLLLWKKDIMKAFKYNVGPSEPKLMSDVQKWGGEFLGTNVCEILKLSLEKPFVSITDLNPPHMDRKSAALRFKLLLDLNGKLINIQATDNTIIGYSLLAS